MAYTTFGYVDIVVEAYRRLLFSFEAANSIVMFGWTTVVIIVAINHISRSLQKIEAMR